MCTLVSPSGEQHGNEHANNRQCTYSGELLNVDTPVTNTLQSLFISFVFILMSNYILREITDTNK